jgi:isoquinoline 1-oxidoreductase beta subunit
MNTIMNVSRRKFLQTSALAGGGLVLGVYVPALDRAANGAQSAQNQPAAPGVKTFTPNAFVRIGSDDVVTVLVNHSEMGQGTFTSLALLAAEELDADWSKVRAEHAPVAPEYNHANFGIQMVGGSTSTWTEWERLRKAGAATRAMLVAAAAAQWSVDPATCHTETGSVIHRDSNRRASYGSLAEAASKQTPPADVKLKDPKDFKLIGKPTRRIEAREKVDGTGVFGLDVKRPGMLVAVIARPPVFGGKVKRVDDSRARQLPGVKNVVQISRGVAIVADGFWNAKKGRDALEVEWDEGPLAALDSGKQRDEYAALAAKPGAVAKNVGDVNAALAAGAKKLSAVYELPYLAHAPMEPQNCVAEVRPDGCDVWLGTQFQTNDRDTAAKITGLPPEKVNVHTMLLGGGFGRRAVPDSHMAAEAVETSKALKVPIKVVWTREDDTRGGFYRPRSYHSIAGAIDAAQNLAAWQHRIVCQSFIAGTPFEAHVIKDGIDATAVEGAAQLPYAIPNLSVDWHMAPHGVPCLWWRSVGHSHNAFVTECFFDELAHAAGKDPFELRRALLEQHPRHKRVLELAAEKVGWGTPPPQGQARGIAVHESFGSFIAQAAEVSVSKEGNVRVHRVVCAVDCGPTVNPEGIRAQMESGVIFGLTAALFGEITFKDGRVVQRNFHDYPMLRINEVPLVETHIVPSTDKMGGIGETGVPPIAPAVCNAIFAATGKRIRRLPIRPEDLIAT